MRSRKVILWQSLRLELSKCMSTTHDYSHDYVHILYRAVIWENYCFFNGKEKPLRSSRCYRSQHTLGARYSIINNNNRSITVCIVARDCRQRSWNGYIDLKAVRFLTLNIDRSWTLSCCWTHLCTNNAPKNLFACSWAFLLGNSPRTVVCTSFAEKEIYPSELFIIPLLKSRKQVNKF